MVAKEKQLEFHSAANIFPLMGDADRERLKEDLIANGQHEQIIEFEGKILDGRNRYLCCLEANIKPSIGKLESVDGASIDPVQYVISQNLHRRQLTNTQRAFCAARMANMPNGVRKGRKPVAASIEAATICKAEAAELFKVSKANLERAKSVLRQGCAELVDLAEAANSVNAFLKFTEYMPAKTEQRDFIKTAKNEAKLSGKTDWRSHVVKAIKIFNKQQREQELAANDQSEEDGAEFDPFGVLVNSIEGELSRMKDNSSAVAVLDRMLERFDERTDFDRLVELWSRVDVKTKNMFREAIDNG